MIRSAIRPLDSLINEYVARNSTSQRLYARAKKEGWLDYEATLAAAAPEFVHPIINELDLISINYTSGTTARPKGVMITHRNAYLNVAGTLMHHTIPLSLNPADVPRQRLDFCVDCDCTRRTFACVRLSRARFLI
jgi:long-subunit acyl-CoA synthetase (AMP-forming)